FFSLYNHASLPKQNTPSKMAATNSSKNSAISCSPIRINCHNPKIPSPEKKPTGIINLHLLILRILSQKRIKLRFCFSMGVIVLRLQYNKNYHENYISASLNFVNHRIT